jgi:hypothetical protein
MSHRKDLQLYVVLNYAGPMTTLLALIPQTVEDSADHALATHVTHCDDIVQTAG